MSKQTNVVATSHETSEASYRAYVIGFALSIALTIASYVVVTRHLFAASTALYIIGALAITQFVLQLVYFLHLRGEAKPRWKLAVFWFMILTVFIVVVGSIWIMNNLNYNMMQAKDMKSYMHETEGL